MSVWPSSTILCVKVMSGLHTGTVGRVTAFALRAAVQAQALLLSGYRRQPTSDLWDPIPSRVEVLVGTIAAITATGQVGIAINHVIASRLKRSKTWGGFL